MQQQTTNNEITLRLAAELEKLQSTLQQLATKSQAQDEQLKGVLAVTPASSVASEDSGSSETSEQDDSDASDEDFSPKSRGNFKPRGDRRNEAEDDDSDSTTLGETPREKQLSILVDSRDRRIEALETELKQLRTAARSFEDRIKIHKLRADMAEKKVKGK